MGDFVNVDEIVGEIETDKVHINTTMIIMYISKDLFLLWLFNKDGRPGLWFAEMFLASWNKCPGS